MQLEVRQREREGITIFDLVGRLIAGQEGGHLRGLLDSAAQSGVPKVILGLKQLTYMDSTGLGVLVAGHSAMRQHGGALKMMQISKRSAELLILTKLATVFEIFGDEQTAVNSFFPDRQVNSFDILEFIKSQQEPP